MSSPRLLFVLSNDYSELSDALYFLEGTDFAATLLLPDRLFAANAEHLPVPASRCRTPDDILAAVDRERPDIVFLFSAYLFAANGLFDIDETGRLIEGLRARGPAIVTSDPFLGLMTRPEESTFSPDHPLRKALADHFARLAPIVSGLTHLYVMPADGISVADRVSFANRRAIRGVAVAEPRRWLFILSAEDHAFQSAALGRAAFEGLLLDHLDNAIRQGRQPVLIAPSACIDGLTASGGTTEYATLLPFCRHDAFREHLLGAEHVFYWNVFSNSIMARVMNRLPVSFLARGHMAHAMPGLHEAGLRHYYPDCELPFLDPKKAPTADDLALAADAQRGGFAGALRRFAESPEPAEVVAQILARRGGMSS
ncbi:MAG TPA: hypothetical protein VGH33_12065 [Isosphaeraceae bacterium]